MYLKQTILACLLVTVSQAALADQLRLKAGYPESYVVQKGDTLWDISGKYLSETLALAPSLEHQSADCQSSLDLPR